MRSTPSIIFAFFAFLITIPGCSPKDKGNVNARVRITFSNGKYAILKNGKPFPIKGASGTTNFDALKKFGGNSVRIWDTTNVKQVLDSAIAKGISVIVGIPLPESKQLSYYDDTVRVSKDFKKIKNLVHKIKSSSAVLMWCVGNELSFPNKPSYNNFYKAFNNIVDMIHKDDPDHPVLTTMVNFQRNDIINIKFRTDVDIISFNIFSRISELKDDLKSFSWLWNGPYLITEWGIDGPWDKAPGTAWNAKIEPTSTQKAGKYLTRYKNYMPTDDPRFLGSFIFFWGQKQEITHTWFSMFDEFGNTTEAVYTASQIWTGKASAYDGPKINGITLSKRTAIENIFIEPNAIKEAEIKVAGDTSGLTVRWEIYPEDWFKKNNVDNLIRPRPLTGLIVSQSAFKITLKTPVTEGPYRLFSTITDKKGNVANANIPFYVLGAHE
ncbi:MAG: hypothetical protein EOP55_02080 [Sphingobacteriales bacterium]|nr:MAG: hypothetical protein EOP55_02080 [Sphingobacteriales bacterium]